MVTVQSSSFRDPKVNGMDESLTIDGITVSYSMEGEGEPLILIHGLNVGRSIWKQFKAEAHQLFTVYAVDLPGFGRSDAPEIDYGVPFYVDYLRKFMDALGIEKAHLAGSSMGGTIAATFAATYPDRVRRLVLLAPAGLTPLHSGIFKSGALVDANFWLLSKNVDLYRKALADSFYEAGNLPQWLVDEGWSLLKNPGNRHAYLKNAQYLARHDPRFRELLAEIKARTLIIWGAEDHLVPAADAKKYVDLIPKAEARIVEHSGHLVLLEHGEQCADIILAFLGEVDLYYTPEGQE